MVDKSNKKCYNSCLSRPMKEITIANNNHINAKYGIPCSGMGTEICYKKCRLVKEEDTITCACTCCPDYHKMLCAKK